MEPEVWKAHGCLVLGLGKLWDHVAGVGRFHLNFEPLTRLHESPVCFFLLLASTLFRFILSVPFESGLVGGLV